MKKNMKKNICALIFGLSCFSASSLLGATGAYISNTSSSNVSVIDVSTNTVIATITVGTNPRTEWATPDLSRVYVHCATGSGGEVCVIDTSTEQVIATITVGPNSNVNFGNAPEVILGGAMTADGHKLVVVNADVNTASVIDTNPSSLSYNTVIATITGVGAGFDSLWPTGITPNGQFAYLGGYVGGNFLNVIDLSTNLVIATITTGGAPDGAAVRSDGTRAYAVEGFGGSHVLVIDTSSQTVVATITVGSDPDYVVLNPLGTKAYAIQGLTSIKVIDTGTNSIVATIPINGSYATMNAAGTKTYVTRSNETLIVIDNNTDSSVATVTLGVGVDDYQISALTPDETQLYLPNSSGAFNYVSVIDTTTNILTATVPVGSRPFFVVMANAVSPSSLGAPGSPTGEQEADCFFDQIDLINVIQWTASTGSPARYNIYRNAALTDLAGSVPASELKFKDHNRKKGVTYTYYIVAVSGSGSTSTAAVVTVRPKKRLCGST